MAKAVAASMVDCDLTFGVDMDLFIFPAFGSTGFPLLLMDGDDDLESPDA